MRRHIRELTVDTMTFARDIPRYVSISICNEFFSKQRRFLHSHLMFESDRMYRKFLWLLGRHEGKIKEKIKPIHYSSYVFMQGAESTLRKSRSLRSNGCKPHRLNKKTIFSSSPIPNPCPSNSSQSYEISLAPTSFTMQ